jgi:hypothetical protein
MLYTVKLLALKQPDVIQQSDAFIDTGPVSRTNLDELLAELNTLDKEVGAVGVLVKEHARWQRTQGSKVRPSLGGVIAALRGAMHAVRG